MGLLTRHTLKNVDVESLKVIAGIDKITLFVFGEWAKRGDLPKHCLDGARSIRAELQTAQDANAIQKFSKGVPVYGGTCYPAHGHPIFGHRVKCPISLHVDGMRIALADIDNHHDTLPVAQVIIDSAALAARGHESCLLQLDHLLKGLGVVVRELTVLRIDVCADVLGLSAAAFLDYVHNGSAVVTKFDWGKRSTWGPAESLQTVACGTSDNIRLQIYDKIARFESMLAENKEREVDMLWAAHCEKWGCIPDQVTRVEFQLGGKYLRGRFSRVVPDGRPVEALRCIGDVVERLDAIAEILFNEQFRIADRQLDRDNRNQSRAVNHPIWQRIIEGVRLTHFGGDGLKCDCVQRIKRQVRAKSVERARQDMRSLAVRTAAMSMPVEQLESMDSAEHWAEFMTKVALDAVSGRSSDLRAAAIASRNEWEAKGLLPDAADCSWPEPEVMGFNVFVDRVWSDGGEVARPKVGPPPGDVPF